jgi:hypothetical protein
MKACLVSSTSFGDFEEEMNQKLSEIQSTTELGHDGNVRHGHVIDVKCWGESEHQCKPHSVALILWEMR